MIHSISIDCQAINRNKEVGKLTIVPLTGCDLVLSFGNQRRDDFIIKADDLIQALTILGIIK